MEHAHVTSSLRRQPCRMNDWERILRNPEVEELENTNSEMSGGKSAEDDHACRTLNAERLQRSGEQAD